MARLSTSFEFNRNNDLSKQWKYMPTYEPAYSWFFLAQRLGNAVDNGYTFDYI